MVSIKSFVKDHFHAEYKKHEKYQDWDKCFISRYSLNRWALNMKKFGIVTKKRKAPQLENAPAHLKMVEKLRCARTVIDEIKQSTSSDSELAHALTSRMVGHKLNVSSTTANKYLNLLEGNCRKISKQKALLSSDVSS